MLTASLLFLAASGVVHALPVDENSSKLIPRQTPVTTVPPFVLSYAPLVWLYSAEAYNPGDIGSQLQNTHPTLNYTPITNGPSPLTLNNLNQLNNDGGDNVYLSSNTDFTKLPSWLHGVKPSNGKTQNAVSCAIIINNKGNNIVDAFYMYFYNYNQGNKVFGIYEAGDHVGDWEHNMIRFNNSQPSQVWYSEHENGQAFEYSAVPKRGQRVISYSANGTHANWATSGTHDHTIPDVTSPIGPVEDYTNQGTLWDPTLNAYFFSVSFPGADGDDSNPTFRALPNPVGLPSSSSSGSTTPVNWLYYAGQWGNEQLNNSDPRQTNIFGITATDKYTSGPTGPLDKDLNRKSICPNNSYPCIIKDSVEAGD